MSIAPRLAPGARSREVLWSVLVLLAPVLVAFPVLLVVGALSMGDPGGCMAGQDPTTCGAAELQRDRGILLALAGWIPFGIYLLAVTAVTVLAVRRRRSVIVAALGVGLMALSTTVGIGYRLLEL